MPRAPLPKIDAALTAPDPRRRFALCFLRLSNRGKQEVSIEMQRNRCLVECDRLTLTPVFYEEGLGKHSANTRTRLPQWDTLYQRALVDPSVYCVMSYDHERSFRNAAAALTSAKELANHGVKLIFVTSGEVDIQSASGKMIFTVQAAFAEHYSNYVSEKLLDHFDELRASGKSLNHRPFWGMVRVGKAPDHSHQPSDELPAVLAWFRLYVSKDIGAPNGAKELSLSGLTRRDLKGNPRALIAKDLRDALSHLEEFKPFLPAALYRAVKRRKEERHFHKANGAQRVYPPPILYRILTCARCGKPYNTTNCWKHGTFLTSYRHRDPVLCGNIIHPSGNIIARMVWQKLSEIEWAEPLKQRIVKVLTEPKDVSVALDTRLMREKLDRRLKNYKQMLADEDITRAEFLEHRRTIEAELKNIPAVEQTPDDPMPESEAWELVNHLTEMLADPTKGTPYTKNQAMRAIFQAVTIDGRRGHFTLTFTLQPLFANVLDTP